MGPTVPGLSWVLYICYSVRLNTALNLVILILIIWAGEFRLREITYFPQGHAGFQWQNSCFLTLQFFLFLCHAAFKTNIILVECGRFVKGMDTRYYYWQYRWDQSNQKSKMLDYSIFILFSEELLYQWILNERNRASSSYILRDLV